MLLLRLGVPKPIAFLIFFPVFAVAQIFAPNCSEGSYTWTYNSANQSPCWVIGSLMGTCYGGQYSVTVLKPKYDYYKGPNDPDLCECSTIGYSLFAACSGCQGGTWITWSEWATNCTRPLQPPGSFPNPIPSGIRVPQWAHIDITTENLWNFNKSYSVGDNPELAPGESIGPASASPTSSSTASSSTASSSTSPIIPPTAPIRVGHKSNSGAIAGGVVGGIAIIAIAVAAVLLYLRRRQRVPPAAFVGTGESQPHMDDASQPLSGGRMVAPSLSSSGSPLAMRFYDPNDPTTFPGSPGPQSLDMPPQGITISQIGSGSTLATTQTSSHGPKGYHGLPMPSV